MSGVTIPAIGVIIDELHTGIRVLSFAFFGGHLYAINKSPPSGLGGTVGC